MKELTIIGRAERVHLPEFGILNVPAKIDTGADSSSIWASDVGVRGGVLCFKLFDEGSKFYTGKEICVDAAHYRMTKVSNSFGHTEMRYVIKVVLEVRGRSINATLTLANRANMTYPMLLGRKLLSKKFLVDVSQGKPLKRAEMKRSKFLQSDLPTQAKGNLS